MPIFFRCRRCRSALSVRSRQAGKAMICPRCNGETAIPSSSELPPSAAEATAPPQAAVCPTAAVTPTPIPPPAIPGPAETPPPATMPAPRTWRRPRGKWLVVVAGVAAAVLVLAVGAILGHAAFRGAEPAPPSDMPEETIADAGDTGASMRAVGLDIGAVAWPALPPGVEEEEEPAAPPSAEPPPPVEESPSPIRVPQVTPAEEVIPKVAWERKTKRRSAAAEEDLRRLLADAPEVGLDRGRTPALVWAYREQHELTLASQGQLCFEPLPLLVVYPELSGFSVRAGRSCTLSEGQAFALDLLSRKLRVYLARLAPVNAQGKRDDPARLRAAMHAEMRGSQPEWLRPEAVPTLTQLLMHDQEPVRLLLVEVLGQIKGRASSVALAQRAVYDLSPQVRAAAIEALRERPRDNYRHVLLHGLRYPLPVMADHAAEALVALEDREAVPHLIGLLKEPDPAAPYRTKSGRVCMQEVVRVNHLANCLMCHPPSVTYQDRVLGVVPAMTWTFPVTGQVTVVPGTRQTFRIPSAQVAQSITTRVNSFTSTLTSSGTTRENGCHNYEALAGTPRVSVGSQPPGGGPGRPPARVPVAHRPQATTPLPLRASPPARPITGVRPPRVVPPDVTVVQVPVMVRGDVTYLRQDFSVQQPVPQPGGLPTVSARFDYLVRVRFATADEKARLPKPGEEPTAYPQRDAVLFALRELTGQDAGDSTAAWQTLYPTADRDAEASRLSQQLMEAPPGRWDVLLAKSRDARGSAHSVALAKAIPKLPDDRRKQARAALAQRMGRMTAATLRSRMQEEDPELRRAALAACLAREDPAFAPDLIALLDDAVPAVAQAAHDGLQELTGQHFATAAEWRRWWKERASEK